MIVEDLWQDIECEAARLGVEAAALAAVIEVESAGKLHARVGDRDAWVKRVAAGLDPVYKSALKGHAGMPARGGMASLSDAEVRRAVEFMLNSGAAAPAAATPVAAAAVDGKKTYDTICMACHATGAAGAPKLGDKAAWAPRLKAGNDALYASALKGKGAMPAKGGNPALSDAEIKASVDYMTAASR